MNSVNSNKYPKQLCDTMPPYPPQDPRTSWDRDRYQYQEYEIQYGPYGQPMYRDVPQVIYARPEPRWGRGTFSFTQQEVQELVISIGVLTLAFTLVLGKNDFLNYIGPSFLAVFTGFFLHEMGHKFMAQSYGLFSEFRMSKNGLLLALVTSFL